MDQFEYKILPSEYHIRIIELLPGAIEDVIRCNLTTELRHHAQKSYDAISYVWGEAKDDEIICCQRSMRVTTNLANALRTIRAKNPKRSTRIWADAISINQHDTGEKNHQVKSMGLVYENATRVHIWLGADECGIAQNLFNLIQEWTLCLNEYKEPSKVPHAVVSSDLCKDSDRGLKLSKLMSMPWFSRVWVVQEVALSESAHLHWGNATMDFADLVELACFCEGNSNVISLIGGDNAGLKLLRILCLCVYRFYGKTGSWGTNKPYYFKGRCERHPADSGLFLDILSIGKLLSASEPQDHIYSFLGNPLALNDKGETIVEPDYCKHEDEVNLQLAAALLKSPESPYVLCFVQHCSAEEITGSKGPSWVPRWRFDKTDQKNASTIGNIGLGYRAGGSAERLQCRIQDNQVLVLQGFIFDQLCWTSELLKTENFALDSKRWNESLRAVQRSYVELLWEEISLAYKQCLGPIKNLNQARYEDDFSYTLVTGYNNPRVVSRKEHKRVFKAYRQVLEKKRDILPVNSEHIKGKRPDEDAGTFETHTRNCSDRRFGITKSERFALVPRCARPGDIFALVLGMVTPFVLRPTQAQFHDTVYYHLVGEAYIDGAMRGELAGNLDKNQIGIMLI
ncbi:hypothetical protein N0V90_003437 [Kalmusia sp. IMI 367209]|nr:hypothetical protein N0V90_003437 [Kalmusia sp. IMI 367209]